MAKRFAPQRSGGPGVFRGRVWCVAASVALSGRDGGSPACIRGLGGAVWGGDAAHCRLQPLGIEVRVKPF